MVLFKRLKMPKKVQQPPPIKRLVRQVPVEEIKANLKQISEVGQFNKIQAQILSRILEKQEKVTDWNLPSETRIAFLIMGNKIALAETKRLPVKYSERELELLTNFG